MHAAIRTAILTLGFGTACAQAADLTVRIEEVKNKDGQLMAALYDSAAGFLTRPVRKATVEAVAGSTTVVFKDLAPGEYGLSVFHDANGNGRLDRNAMGMPIEQVGFSKDAQGFMGPPAFDAVRFTVPESGAGIVVTLR
jgi:uncharacterized protein (DUF2141 family)